jgi:hypothetical protein
MSEYQQLYSGTVHAKWHSIFVDAIENDRGLWLQITETRPRGHRSYIVVDAERCEDFERELLKALSVIRAPLDPAHSASAVRGLQRSAVVSTAWRLGRLAPCRPAPQSCQCTVWQHSNLPDGRDALWRNRSGRPRSIVSALQRERLKHLQVEVREA